MGDPELLYRHNPVLVIHPQEHEERKRPGAWFPGKRGWGEYHPCNAEFFLHRVEQRDHPQRWSFHPRKLLSGITQWAWHPCPRTGIDEIRRKLEQRGPEGTDTWELDVSDLPSQHEKRAWTEYRRILGEQEHAFEPTVYGRMADTDRGSVLQYWYLYVYNDFRNNHEGDWEMVTIELDPTGEPVRAGYSCHHSGWARPWTEVPRADATGLRPLLYVARGSHAGYFQYFRKGQHTVGFSPASNPPFGLRRIWSFIQRLPGIERWRDFTPADPERDMDRAVTPEHVGVRLDPELRVMPVEPNDDPDWWWMRLRCSWGSTHTRLSGTIGPRGPWMGHGLDLRWRDPIGWLDRCTLDSRPE